MRCFLESQSHVFKAGWEAWQKHDSGETPAAESPATDESGESADVVASASPFLMITLEEALEIFEEAYEFCDEEEEPTLLFYIGYTHLLMGSRGLALEKFSEVQMDPSEELFGEYTVLKGQLLMESLAFTEALGVFDSYLDERPDGEARQLVYLLSGYSENALGETARARSSLQKAVDLGAQTDYGREASSLLGKLKG